METNAWLQVEHSMFDSRQEQALSFATISRVYPASCMGTGVSLPGVKLSERQADHLPLSSAEAKNAWSCGD
jgi:hypothetical protein